MKRTFLFILTAAFLSMPLFADSYRDALKSYLKSADVSDSEKYAAQLRTMSQQLFQNDPKKGEAIMNEYIQSQFTDDMVELYLPYFRKHVTEADLKQLEQQNSNPRYAEVGRRAKAVVDNLASMPEYQKFMTDYQQAMMDIVQGNKPKNMKMPSSISKEYIDVFNNYYRVSGTDKIIDQSFSSITDYLGSALKQQGMANADQIIKQLKAYTSDNIPILLASIFHKSLTEVDLKIATEMVSSEAQQHTIAAVAEMTSDPIQLGINLLDHVATWLDTHYPQEAKPFHGSVEQLKSLK